MIEQIKMKEPHNSKKISLKDIDSRISDLTLICQSLFRIGSLLECVWLALG
jgi:hypothetical protein